MFCNNEKCSHSNVAIVEAIIQNGCISKHVKASSKNGLESTCISLYLFGSNTSRTLSAF